MAVYYSSASLALVILTFAWPFIGQDHDKYNVTQGPIGGPEVVRFMHTRALPTWCSE
jgi:hypothetical protein